jgi:AraC-like DNA-binding protein
VKQTALTRASTIGPILDFLKCDGASIERVFRSAELPLRLTERPDILIPLRDQFRLVECAARELGDDALPARLAVSAGIAGLGAYGREFLAANTLGEAINRGNEIYTSTLQSATRMTLTVRDQMAHWTYQVTEPIYAGRQKNEILAVGYMVQLVRRFAGADWTPSRTQLPGSTLLGRTAVETLFRCEISRGDVVSMSFPADLLDCPGPAHVRSDADRPHSNLPSEDDLAGCVQELIRLSLIDGPPQRRRIARRLDMSVRTLQRRLQESGTNFAELLRRSKERLAIDLLDAQGYSVLEIAYELGYSDPAHFTRAFTNWYGEAPQNWRRRRTAKAGQHGILS